MKHGNLVVLPGLPAFYDYEWYPQPNDVCDILQYSKHCIHQNGIFSATKIYQWASMISLRLERSKFTLSQGFWSNLTTNSDRFIKECDAFIYFTCSAYEPEAIYATRQWLKESGSRKLYAIGPIFPWSDATFESSKYGLLATDHEAPEYGTPVRAFMDRILASHGENSLLYVSNLAPTFPQPPYYADSVAGQFRCHSEVWPGPRATTSDCTLKSF